MVQRIAVGLVSYKLNTIRLGLKKRTMSKALPKELTSYDLLKTVAIILMVVDHIGYYFFPEENWWRVFGRLCVPIWFFLIGYARSRDLGPKMWIGGLILVAGNVVAGLSIFPLNILGTMIAVRLLIDPVMKRALRQVSHLWGIAVLLTLLILPTVGITEYGTQALLTAMFGYLVRHQGEIDEAHKFVPPYFMFALISFVIVQFVMFLFNDAQVIVLSLGLLVVMGVLYFFKPVTYPRLTKALPGPFVKLVQLTGRRTLEFYVLHLLLFKGLGMWLDPERFSFMDWTWMMAS